MDLGDCPPPNISQNLRPDTLADGCRYPGEVAEKPYREPKLELNRIYTKQGDAGETRLVGGQAVPKDHPRLECYGTVDELNACAGTAALTANGLSAREPRLKPLAETLRRVQHELFNLGSILATLPEDIGPQQPRVTGADVAELEREIDTLNASCRRSIRSSCRAAAA